MLAGAHYAEIGALLNYCIVAGEGCTKQNCAIYRTLLASTVASRQTIPRVDMPSLGVTLGVAMVSSRSALSTKRVVCREE